MNFLRNLFYKFQNYMYYRYGMDDFSKFLTIFAFVMLLLSSFFSMPIFQIIGTLALMFILFRMFSKNHEKRRAELRWYYEKKNKYTNKISSQKKLHQMRKTHRIYKCKNCKTMLRVPKGVGKIKITCSKCKTTMIKKA